MKKRILSKIFTHENLKGEKVEIHQFGENVPIDFSNCFKISFYLRKHFEFTKKEYGKKLIIDYCSNTIYPKKAYIFLVYITIKKPNPRIFKSDFQIFTGCNTLEFEIPAEFMKLSYIELYLTAHENVKYKHYIRFNDIRFEN